MASPQKKKTVITEYEQNPDFSDDDNDQLLADTLKENRKLKAENNDLRIQHKDDVAKLKRAHEDQVN